MQVLVNCEILVDTVSGTGTRAHCCIFIALKTKDNVSSKSGENDFAECEQLYSDDQKARYTIFKETVDAGIPQTIKTGIQVQLKETLVR